jgi:hypothetical protein
MPSAPASRRRDPAGSDAGRLLRLVLTNLGTGILASCLLVGGLMALNPHGLRDLILADHTPALALVLLCTGFAMTFGVAAIGTALMLPGSGTPPRGPARAIAIAARNTPASGGRFPSGSTRA